MRKECPECRTVSGGQVVFCGSCGYRFKDNVDPVRAMLHRPKKEFGAAVVVGVAVAIVQYFVFHR